MHWSPYHAMTNRIVNRICSRVCNGIMPNMEVKIFESSCLKVWLLGVVAHSNSSGYCQAWLHQQSGVTGRSYTLELHIVCQCAAHLDVACKPHLGIPSSTVKDNSWQRHTGQRLREAELLLWVQVGLGLHKHHLHLTFHCQGQLPSHMLLILLGHRLTKLGKSEAYWVSDARSSSFLYLDGSARFCRHFHPLKPSAVICRLWLFQVDHTDQAECCNCASRRGDLPLTSDPGSGQTA